MAGKGISKPLLRSDWKTMTELNGQRGEERNDGLLGHVDVRDDAVGRFEPGRVIEAGRRGVALHMRALLVMPQDRRDVERRRRRLLVDRVLLRRGHRRQRIDEGDNVGLLRRQRLRRSHASTLPHGQGAFEGREAARALGRP